MRFPPSGTDSHTGTQAGGHRLRDGEHLSRPAELSRWAPPGRSLAVWTADTADHSLNLRAWVLERSPPA
jgi:hypothetical protein